MKTDTTVGRLCADDLFHTEVELDYRNSMIRGKLTSLEFTSAFPTLAGTTIEVSLTAGGITVEGLPRGHPCRLIRTQEA